MLRLYGGAERPRQVDIKRPFDLRGALREKSEAGTRRVARRAAIRTREGRGMEES
jgi:hypothetical protein